MDPSHYISRFSALLEFGDETHKVAVDAVRIVQRFDRDWMTRGRRPAGICGAALLLAARMNNFRRSVEEIVQVVKIADTTLRKRLEEFKTTPSGGLTLADFRNVWLEDEMDPPAFTRGREKEEAEKRALEGDEEDEGREGKGKGKIRSKKTAKKRKGKRKRGDVADHDQRAEQEDTASTELLSKQPLNPSVLTDSILADAIDPTSLCQTAFVDDNSNIDPVLLQEYIPGVTSVPPVAYVEEQVSQVLAEEVANFLNNPQGAEITDALDEVEERRLAQLTVVDELTGLNEEELDRFILSEEEVKIKERVWVELNREYLEALAGEYFSSLDPHDFVNKVFLLNWI